VWAYLESIFVGSEDIRKQLPHETKMFEGVNDMFISNMATMHASSPYPLKFSPSLFLQISCSLIQYLMMIKFY
jgi:hypothetical protein